MLGLYKANVNRGLINGSAFDDKMAFADALHELQEDGWNPEKGKEYRQSKDFKKLEKQLLNGRKHLSRRRGDKPWAAAASATERAPIPQARG